VKHEAHALAAGRLRGVVEKQTHNGALLILQPFT
jgi:hypothetical protein